MRFYYHKHQCYVVGEGSFIGNCGDLTGLTDAVEENLDAQSVPRSISPSSVTPLNDNQFLVTAEVEQTQGAAFIEDDVKPPLSLNPDIESGPTSSLDDDSRVVKSKHIRTEDEVVIKDGTYVCDESTLIQT